MTAPIRIGSRRQLFFDDRFVTGASGMHHALELPFLPTENLLTAAKPWESDRAGGYCSVVHHDGRFRIWYDGIDRQWRSLCYAESEDGIRFVFGFDGRADRFGADVRAVNRFGEIDPIRSGAVVVGAARSDGKAQSHCLQHPRFIAGYLQSFHVRGEVFRTLADLSGGRPASQ